MIPGMAFPGGKPGAKQFGSFDGLDNRRELWRLLERLGKGVSPIECYRRRFSFVKAMCELTGVPSVDIDPNATLTVSECYWAILALATNYGLDLDRAAKLLEQWVRKLTAGNSVPLEESF